MTALDPTTQTDLVREISEFTELWDGKTLNKEAVKRKLEEKRFYAIGADQKIWYYNRVEVNGETPGVWRKSKGKYSVIKEDVSALLKNSSTRANRGEIEEYIGTTIQSFDIEPITDPLINLSNCIYNFDKQRDEPHSHLFYSVNQMDIKYNPKATEHPNWDHYLKLSCKTEEDIIRTKQIVAYMLTPSNPLQKAFIVTGKTNSGKSLLIRLLEAMIGNGNYSNVNVNEFATNRFSKISLRGKTANFCGDVSVKYVKDEGTFKQLTGEDTIHGEYKGVDGISFKNYAKLMFTTNSPWKTADLDESYFNRIEFISMPDTISKEDMDKDLLEKLIAEIPAIFNDVMKHLPDVFKNKEFLATKASDKLMAKFRLDSDPIAIWLEDDIAVESSEVDGPVLTVGTDVWSAYKLWCADAQRHSGNKSTFLEGLERLGYRYAKAKESLIPTKPWCVYGIAIKGKSISTIVNKEGK